MTLFTLLPYSQVEGACCFFLAELEMHHLVHHRSHLSCRELIHRAWGRLLTPCWREDEGKGMLVLLNVINRTEGFVWDGAICFLFFLIFFYGSRGLFLDSPSEAAGDTI